MGEGRRRVDLQMTRKGQGHHALSLFDFRYEDDNMDGETGLRRTFDCSQKMKRKGGST